MIKQLPQGALGFDTNQTLTLDIAKKLRATGYSFAIRYIPILQRATGDITTQEINDIVTAGLGLLLVQHCRYPGWVPSGDLGTKDATRAVAHLNTVGMPKGVNVYLDLEGVKPGVSTGDILAFCNNWYDIINNAGYTPGIYVGFDCGLTGDTLYHGLKFQHYWKSGANVPDIPIRGYEMVQTIPTNGKSVYGINIDEDTVLVDKLNNSPQALFADAIPTPKTLLRTLSISFYSDGSYEIK